jgi:hypothetical protein
VKLDSPPSGIPESGLFFFDKPNMDIVPFQMDLLRLAAAVAQQEQFPARTLPALEEATEQLKHLETADPLAVPSGSGH